MCSATKKIFLLLAVIAFSINEHAHCASPPPNRTLQTDIEVKDSKSCKRLFSRFAIPWKGVWSKHALTLKAEDTNGLAFIEDMTTAHCDDPTSNREFVALISRILNQHSGKLAAILPLSTKSYAKHILKGLEAQIRAQGSDPSKILLVLDTQSKLERTEQLLAEALFKHQVSAVLGGAESTEVELLSRLGPKLLVPMFILNKPPLKHVPEPFVYYVHPSPQGIAKALIGANQRYLHKKVSILRSSDRHSDQIAREYEVLAKTASINVMHNVIYDSRRIDLMEMAARKLFKLEPNDRLEDLKKLYETAKQQAKKSGENFNPKMVALQPVVDQDAVLILDQFKIVRHMAKIFSFLGVHKIPMFGHYEWRSIGLVEPFDPFFAGSYFVDLIGAYEAIPVALQVKSLTSNSNFIPPDRIEEVDFSMIGYRAAETQVNLAMLKQVPRRKLDSQIPREDQNSPQNSAFDESNVIRWPTFLFEVVPQGKRGTIQLK